MRGARQAARTAVRRRRTGRSWIVLGYSGDNDPVFQRLATVERFDYGLYWVGYLDAEPSPSLRTDLLEKSKQAYFVRGYDADRFFVELAQRLGCFPPGFVDRPFTHLREMLGVLTPFRPPGMATDLDVLDKPRELLDLAIRQHELAAGDAAAPMAREPLELALNALLMAGRYADVQAIADRLDLAAAAGFKGKFAWAYILEGNVLLNWAGSETGEAAEALYREAGEKYAEAVRIKPDLHEAFNNWGLALAAWAGSKTGAAAEALYREAGEKYAEAVRIKPDLHEAFNNWGLALADWAGSKTGAEAEALLGQAEEKLRQTEALRAGSGAYNLACVAARRGQEDDCKHWLGTARDQETLPDRAHLESDSDLDPMRECGWFRDLLATL